MEKNEIIAIDAIKKPPNLGIPFTPPLTISHEKLGDEGRAVIVQEIEFQNAMIEPFQNLGIGGLEKLTPTEDRSTIFAEISECKIVRCERHIEIVLIGKTPQNETPHEIGTIFLEPSPGNPEAGLIPRSPRAFDRYVPGMDEVSRALFAKVMPHIVSNPNWLSLVEGLCTNATIEFENV